MPNLDLLQPAVRGGQRVDAGRTLEQIRDYARAQFAYFATHPNYPALVDHYLDEATDELRDWLAKRHAVTGRQERS